MGRVTQNYRVFSGIGAAEIIFTACPDVRLPITQPTTSKHWKACSAKKKSKSALKLYC